MGRSKKVGLDYFPFDIGFFQDLKIRKLIKYQGGKAVTVYAFLLCNIYKQGYYMRWDEELPFIVSGQTGFEEAYIREVIKCCLVVGLFSKKLYESENVLTSKGIQERYQMIGNLYRRKVDISSEFMLISSTKMGINATKMGINATKMGINVEEKNKRKEKKEKYTKENKREENKREETTLSGSQEKPQADFSSTTSPVSFGEDISRLKDFFNAEVKGSLIPPICSINGQRKGFAKARLREYGKQDVITVIRKAVASDFLNGKNNRGWTADFNWIFRPNNFPKILEGNYDNRQQPQNNQASSTDARVQRRNDAAEIMARLAAEDDANSQVW